MVKKLTFFESVQSNPEMYESYQTHEKTCLTWCEGCGNFSIKNSLLAAVAKLKKKKNELIFCFDVGCSGNGSDKIEAYTIHGLHGRTIPLAAGISLARQDLTVIAQAGDGATLSEGLQHFLHAARANYNITFLLHNNRNFALTTGQPSPTSIQNSKMNAAPMGVKPSALRALELALCAGGTFVARTNSALFDHMTQTFTEAIMHTGFSVVEILQECPTYNRNMNHKWYLEQNTTVENLNEFGDTGKNSRKKAKTMLREDKEETLLGIFYQQEKSSIQELPKKTIAKGKAIDSLLFS